MSLDAIEPFVSLGFSEEHGRPDEVSILVPLTGNRNDKGTLFGGSMFSGMLLAGWRLCGLHAGQTGGSGDIYVKDSAVRFLRPILSDMTAVARLAETPKTTRRGNVAYEVEIEAVDSGGRLCGRATASFRLLPRAG